MMKVKITRLNSYAKLPEYQTSGAAAMDIHAALESPMTIGSFERKVVPTGFAIALPIGYEAQIRARSGLSLTYGITVASGVGTIDADYRGEVGIILINLSQEPFEITPGMRIAQMIIASHETVEWDEVKRLDVTERGKGGYGSTGH